MGDDFEEMAEIADAALGMLKGIILKVAADEELLGGIADMYLGIWKRLQSGGMDRNEATQVVAHMQTQAPPASEQGLLPHLRRRSRTARSRTGAL